MIDRSLRRLLVVLVAIFAVLLVQVSRIQVIDADSLRSNPDNSRSILRDFNQARGDIVTADGVVVAESESVFDSRFDFQRLYPEGELYAHVVGYYSFNLGAAGVEKAYNRALTGRSPSLRTGSVGALLGGTGEPGEVQLSLLHRMQTEAAEALAGREGAVVVIEPDTGALVALYSSPSFDPSSISGHDGAEAERNSEQLNDDPARPRLARAYADIFFPGSTFKIVTAAAALEGRPDEEGEVSVASADSYLPPLVADRPIRNSNGRPCGGTIAEMIAVSCNTGFARLAAESIGPDRLVETAEAFGFNAVPPLDIDGAVASVVPSDYGERLREPTPELPAGVYEDSAKLAQVALGQNSVQATPLQMALVAAGVANAGELPSPHVVSEIRNEDGGVVERIEPQPWRRAISPETALILQDAMYGTVADGTATGLHVPGLAIGAKTGTAQISADVSSSHAWAIGFAGDPGFRPDIAFAVFVAASDETPQGGSSTAVPIARRLVTTYFGL